MESDLMNNTLLFIRFYLWEDKYLFKPNPPNPPGKNSPTLNPILMIKRHQSYIGFIRSCPPGLKVRVPTFSQVSRIYMKVLYNTSRIFIWIKSHSNSKAIMDRIPPMIIQIIVYKSSSSIFVSNQNLTTLLQHLF